VRAELARVFRPHHVRELHRPAARPRCRPSLEYRQAGVRRSADACGGGRAIRAQRADPPQHTSSDTQLTRRHNGETMSSKDSGLLIIAGADVRHVLPMSDCIEAVDRAMRGYSDSRAEVPLRTIMLLPGGRNFYGVMPGYLDDPRALGAKILTVYPDNTKRGLASHIGLVVLFDTEIGIPLAVMDAAQVTAIRTAAASGVATRALARKDASHLAILGTGEQAATHLEAIAKIRELEAVRVWGRSSDKAQRFAGEASARLSLSIEVAKTAEDAVQGADIVCTVTASH